MKIMEFIFGLLDTLHAFGRPFNLIENYSSLYYTSKLCTVFLDFTFSSSLYVPFMYNVMNHSERPNSVKIRQNLI